MEPSPASADPVRRGSRARGRASTASALALLCLARAGVGLWLLPAGMFAKYPQAAQLLRAHRLSLEQASDFSPLYLLINLAVPPTPLRWLQAAVLAACIASAFFVSARFFGSVAGWVAAGLVALSSSLLLYEATLEPDLLLSGLCFLGVSALALAGARERPGRAYALGGTLLGVAALARPTGLLMGGVCLGVLGVRALWSRSHPSQRAFAIVGASSVAAFTLAWIPVHHVITGRTGSTMGFGEIFFQGNRPESSGLDCQQPALIKLLELQTTKSDTPDSAHALYRRFARADLGQTASALDTQLYFVKKVLAFARLEPVGYLELLGRKSLFLLFEDSAHHISEVRDAETKLERLPFLPSSLIGILGLSGALAALLARRSVPWMLLYTACAAAMTLGFCVSSRYCLPLNLGWAVLATGWAALAGPLPRRWVAIATTSALALLLFVAKHSLELLRGSDRQIERARSSASASYAMARARERGDLSGATQSYLRAFASAPYVSVTRDLRGIPFESPELALDAGRLATEHFGVGSEADAFFAAMLASAAGRCMESREALANNHFRSTFFDIAFDPKLLLARCLLANGQRQDALAALRSSLDERPAGREALALASVGAGLLGHEDDARRWHAELYAVHDGPSATHALVDANLRWGLPRAALSEASALVAALPDSGLAQYDHALALMAVGRAAEALEAYRRALELFPLHAFATRPFDRAIDDALAQAPISPAMLALAVEHRVRAGRLEQAQMLEERLSQLQPSSKEERPSRVPVVVTSVPRRYLDVPRGP